MSVVFPATRQSWIDLSLREPLKGQAGLQMMDGWKVIQQSTILLQKLTVLNWKKNTSFKLKRNKIKLEKNISVSLSTVRSIISSGSVEIKP